MIRFFTLAVLLLTSFFVAHAQDITVSMVGKTTFAPNEEFLNEITVKNEGIVATASFYTGIYISTDNKWQISDKEIGSLGPVNLAAGASNLLPASTYASILAIPGNYFLIIRADRYNAIVETDETNNELITPITVTSPQIDFSFDSFSLSKTSFTQNEAVKFSYSASNKGSANAGGPVFIALYISTDASWSTDDKYLDDDAEYLNGSDLITRSVNDYSTCYVPNSPPGNYYIIAKLDELNTYSETDKTNNTAAVPITISAADIDLRIDSFYQIPQSPGSTMLYVIVNLTNSGTTAAGPVQIDGALLNGYYEQPVFPFSDSNEYVLPGETKPLYISFSLFDQHTYATELKLTVNAGRLVAETDYSNNSITQAIIITPPVESLTINGLSYAGEYDNTDKDFTLNFNVQNTGTSNYSYQVYTIEIRNVANTLVHSEDIYPSIYAYPGSSQSVTSHLTLSSPLPPGQYQTLIKCSTYPSCITTFNESTIALDIQQIQYTLTGTIKGENGTPITKGNLFLYQKTDDGTVKFIQKVTPITSSSFSFPVDQHKHTLYFIPDRQAYPDYVPTVYGKTLTLENESLFELTQNTNVQFEIIKIQPLTAQGDGIISGTVTNEAGAAAGRISSLSAGAPVANAPVVLLSSTGVVNGLTYTNESGYYEFRNLPRASYQLLVSHELNVSGMEEPYPVSITAKNAEINFTAGTSEVTVHEQVLLFDQTIRFVTISSLRYGSTSIGLSAQSSSSLPVSFSVSDPTLAEIKDDQLIIKGVGSLTVSATQQGNDFYKEAITAQTFIIDKGLQQISFNPLATKTFGDKSFTINATSSVKLPVTFTSSDSTVASIKDNTISIMGAGKVTLSASQSGNALYEQTIASQELTISKATQHINFVIIPEQQLYVGELFLITQASSGLDITLTSSNEKIVSIENGKVMAHNPGEVTITANQSGDKNYMPAESQSITMVINAVTGVEEIPPVITLYPNPSSDLLFIDHDDDISNIEIIDIVGRSITGWTLSANSINVENLSSGTYLLKLTSQNRIYSMRFAKR